MGSGIPVGSEDDLILEFEDLDRPAQVPCLESRLEDESGIVFRGRDVER